MLVDDLALVGSHNLNYRCFSPRSSLQIPPHPPRRHQPPSPCRSIVHDLECEVMLSHPHSISVLADAFVADTLSSARLQLPALGHLRWWQRAAARMALWFKRMI